MPAIRPASAKRQAKRQSPTRSRTMRRYLRRGAAERPRIAADARDLHRGRRIVRRTFGARSDHPALRARPRRGSVSGRRSVLGGHSGRGPALAAVWTSHRPLRRAIAADLLAARGRGLAARGGRHDDGPPVVHLADRRRARRGGPANGALLRGGPNGGKRAARPGGGGGHVLHASPVFYLPPPPPGGSVNG